MTPETEEIEPTFRRERVFKTVEEFLLRVLVMPTLIVFEDTHWIDDASHSVLLHLVRSTEPRPWLLAITRRPQGLPFVDEPGNGQRLLELSALGGRGDGPARARVRRRGRPLRGAARRGLGALGREPALRARARRRLPRRRRRPRRFRRRSRR